MTLSLDEIERRILRAILTVLVVRDPEGRFRRDLHAFWLETFDPQDYPPESRPRLFEPTREDLDRYLDDLSWLSPFSKRDQQLMRWRALGFSWRGIAEKRGSSHEHWRQRYEGILDRIAGALRRFELTKSAENPKSHYSLRFSRPHQNIDSGLSVLETT